MGGGCALAPGIASAADEQYLEPYRATVDDTDAGHLADAGVDLEHAGYRPGKGYEQPVQVALFPSQAKALEAKGVDLTRMAVPRTARRETGGDSPNEYYDVYRSYMEDGGILDEMQQIARENRDVVKPMIVGTSTRPRARAARDARAVVDADPEPGRLRLHVHVRPGHGQPAVRARRGRVEPVLAQDAARQQRQRDLRRRRRPARSRPRARRA